MKKYFFYITSILFLVSCGDKIERKKMEVIIPNPNQEVVGYLPYYSMNTISQLDFSQLTQVAYFSFSPKADGSLNKYPGSTTHLTTLKNAIGDNNVKIFICIGGDGISSNFASMASTKEKRTKFIAELKDFCLEEELAGADIDWEFPVGATERANCTLLFQEMKEVFKENNLLLTSAQRANPNDLDDEALQYLDQINVMAYDAGAYHSTYEYAVSCVNHFLRRGAKRSQITLGVPFYGRNIGNPSQSSTYQNLRNHSDFNPFNPSLNEVNGYSFNGQNMISQKTQYAIDQGLKGMMIWELGHDTRDTTSLLKAIDDTKKRNLKN